MRLYPLGQQDLGIEQHIVAFKTAKGETSETMVQAGEKDEGVADIEDGAQQKVASLQCSADEAVDYTPPQFISGIITESGVLLPSAVSEELIKIWF